ncbi:stage II sporulation protein D [Paenibacillus physcomitrellae]|uniref:Sporulation stage II protein D amidase enhancer LytB N-terminal domain-containing protein n=1 Tax=Paenibacillus physcomitrellae TaxID=1619311 RepID=A0ABQ1GHZ0_9BACL|nr:stage II sporulation protein D [Paenibacillus physcomitrellae]GGA43994.1 hypothetical protein GCM10010917_31640 [Paenibacillus physcomitrellae]
MSKDRTSLTFKLTDQEQPLYEQQLYEQQLYERKLYEQQAQQASEEVWEAMREPSGGQGQPDMKNKPLRWPSGVHGPLRLRPGVRRPPRWGFRRPPRWGGPRRRRRLRLPMAAAGIAALAVLLPALLVHRGGANPPPQGTPAAGQQQPAAQTPPAAVQRADGPPVSVYLSDTGGVETLPLEQYVLGVLVAEMPSDFGIEAMKAQAIAARTFIVKRLAAGDRSGVPEGSADVTDTVTHQAYLSKAELTAWKQAGKGAALQKLQQAVDETAGIIMTYDGQPISALFFSASGGYTENSEDYWSERIPYLRSVASPWDAQIDPSYKETVQMPLQEIYSKLGLSAASLPALAGTGTGQAAQTAASLFTVLDRTQGDSIKEIRIGGKLFTGREVREKLGLRSSHFDIKMQQNEALITTYGYGHGVGMSQWGANGMAKEGYTAAEILKHYYTGISLVPSTKFIK